MAASPLQTSISIFVPRDSVSKQGQFDIATCETHETAQGSLITDRVNWSSGTVILPEADRTASQTQGCLNLAEVLQVRKQDFLWRVFFLDPGEWWDNRPEKRSSRHPDFRHKSSKEALWADNRCRPAWVDSQIAIRDCQLAQSALRFVLKSTIRNATPQTPHQGMGRVLDTGEEVLQVKRGMSYQSSGTSERRSCLDQRSEACRMAKCQEQASSASHSTQCEAEQLFRAVEALDFLLEQGLHIDISLIYGVLRSCIAQKNLVLSKRVHALAREAGHETNAVLANQMISLYALYGKVDEAMEVFDNLSAPNAHVWTSIILAHARHGQAKQAIKLYQKMRESNVTPDNHIFVAALKACCAAADLEAGKEVHADILKSRQVPNLYVGNCLVDMYAKCGSLENARKVFDHLPTRDVVTWTAMICGYAQHKHCKEALAMFASMQEEAITPNHVTFVCLLEACASVGALKEGRKIHSVIVDRDLDVDLVLSNSLVDMYAKCGDLSEARRLFDEMLRKDVVTWTAMISGYVQHGLGQVALTLFKSMQDEGKLPANRVTFLCLLQACTSLGALQQGKQLHEHIRESGLEGDVAVGNCLVDMYAKCGKLEDAREVLDQLPTRDVVTWTTLLNGYAQQGDGQRAMDCVEEMQKQDVMPNETTFLCLLVACSHGGLVCEGRAIFSRMKDHGILPTEYHFNCMVDILGRSGHLEEAEKMLLSSPFDSCAVGWTSLLSACKGYNDADLGRRCFDRLVSLEPENAAPYVLLGTIYANTGRFEEAYTLEGLRKSRGVKKKPAKAGIEVRNIVHEFTVGEENGDLSVKVRSVNSRVKHEGGHEPHRELVLQALPDSEKEDTLCGHAEKLALAYGLLNTANGTPLLVTKNLRMCNDCHSSSKILSKIENREIIVRDANRVHCFVDGSCSCGDRQ